MSYFSAALTELKGARTQKDFAALAKVRQGHLSELLNEDRKPTLSIALRLASAFPKAEAALLAAYLKDLVPERLRGRIDILLK